MPDYDNRLLVSFFLYVQKCWSGNRETHAQTSATADAKANVKYAPQQIGGTPPPRPVMYNRQ